MTRTSMTLQRNGETVEVDVYGTGFGPEHDVGIMARYFEDIHAKDMSGQPVELTAEEECRADELLTERDLDDANGDEVI